MATQTERGGITPILEERMLGLVAGLGSLCGLFGLPAVVTYLERHMLDDNRRSDVVAQVMAADFSAFRACYLEKCGLGAEEVERHETEFRRFFAIMALHPGVKFGVTSTSVRAYWAAAARCEPAYFRFCIETGRSRLDFDPHNLGQVLVGRTWVAYREIFRMEPSADVWPRPHDKEIATCGVRRQQPRRKPRDGLVPLLGFARPEVAVYVDAPDDGGFGFEGRIVSDLSKHAPEASAD